MAFRCLLVDDDPLIGDLLKHFCSKTEKVSYCILATNATDGLSLLAAGGLDLIFLDYNLPDMKGQGVSGTYASSGSVIMVTSEAEFAAKSYDYDQVVDFLVKPLSFDRFLKAVDRVAGNVPELPKSTVKDKSIFLKDGSKLVRIQFEDVLFIKSEGNYANFVQEQSQTMNLVSMKELEDKLPSDFIRVHRSYIVNRKKIQVILLDELIINDRHIPIGEKYKAELLKTIEEL